mgnify:FL=1
MSSPIQAIAEYGRRLEQEARDKDAVSRGGAALLDVDRAHWKSGQLADRIASGLAIVRVALSRCREPVIAFSGGKDSICTMALVHTVDPMVPVLWSDDELEYPEVVSYMRCLAICAMPVSEPEFLWLQGGSVHGGWFRPWVDKPFFREPDRRMIWREPHQGDSQDWLRDQGYDLTFLGTRMGESRRRRDHLLVSHSQGPVQAVKRGTGQHCTPIWDWTEAEVWALIGGWNLPYPVVYDRLAELRVERHRQRVGPLPLARREDLASGWPDLITALEARYGSHWLT